MQSEMSLEQARKLIEGSGLVMEAEMGSDESVELYSFAFNSLLMADKIHAFHFSCESGFQHTHFQEVYETIRNFADELTEITLSGGVAYKYVPMLDILKQEPFTMKMAVDTIEGYIEDLEKLSELHADNTKIANLIDDTIEKLSKEVGLLRSFK